VPFDFLNNFGGLAGSTKKNTVKNFGKISVCAYYAVPRKLSIRLVLWRVVLNGGQASKREARGQKKAPHFWRASLSASSAAISSLRLQRALPRSSFSFHRLPPECLPSAWHLRSPASILFPLYHPHLSEVSLSPL
jgi:hypothetical protein